MKTKLWLLGVLLMCTSCGVKRAMQDRPDLIGIENIESERVKHNDSTYSLGKNSLFKNEHGIWELYLEGDALERGIASGSLTRELIAKQEKAFMRKLEAVVPSQVYRNFLKRTIAWFNRRMPRHIPEEYKQEIYGISRFAPSEFENFAPAYLRMLYYHAAHDIGHALQDLMLVGCTSFAAWDQQTEDGELLLGRNFDFYAGDEFSEEKIVAFINPSKGHEFMMYTWGGMIGTVSGMNEKGLSVTINAGKSKIPLLAKTPISLVAREILQYASTTAEAEEIARKREVFVAEAIMVGSAAEEKAVLLEMAPGEFGVFEVENSNRLVCSNHFQSKNFAEERRNKKAILKSHSEYRYKRMQELLEENHRLTPEKAAAILRNKDGLGGRHLGYGNEKAINQLLAHHGIIFKPAATKVWVSANPYQLGEFVAYDLTKVFAEFDAGKVRGSVASATDNISRDPFANSEEFRKYEEFRKLSREISEAISAKKEVNPQKVENLKHLNPHFWKAYALAGDYYFTRKNYKQAVIDYKQALRREVTTLPDREKLEKKIKKAYRHF